MMDLRRRWRQRQSQPVGGGSRRAADHLPAGRDPSSARSHSRATGSSPTAREWARRRPTRAQRHPSMYCVGAFALAASEVAELSGQSCPQPPCAAHRDRRDLKRANLQAPSRYSLRDGSAPKRPAQPNEHLMVPEALLTLLPSLFPRLGRWLKICGVLPAGPQPATPHGAPT